MEALRTHAQDRGPTVGHISSRLKLRGKLSGRPGATFPGSAVRDGLQVESNYNDYVTGVIRAQAAPGSPQPAPGCYR